jgi:hypothetical protein
MNEKDIDGCSSANGFQRTKNVYLPGRKEGCLTHPAGSLHKSHVDEDHFAIPLASPAIRGSPGHVLISGLPMTMDRMMEPIP